ncbi:MAG: DUF167 domain-containing protein [Vicinamibacteria bacterium]
MRVRVRPRASRDGLAGERAGALVVRLTAPPVEGEANMALARFLGRVLQVPPSSIKIVRGVSSRDKVLLVEGLAADTLRQRIEGASA